MSIPMSILMPILIPTPMPIHMYVHMRLTLVWHGLGLTDYGFKLSNAPPKIYLHTCLQCMLLLTCIDLDPSRDRDCASMSQSKLAKLVPAPGIHLTGHEHHDIVVCSRECSHAAIKRQTWRRDMGIHVYSHVYRHVYCKCMDMRVNVCTNAVKWVAYRAYICA